MCTGLLFYVNISNTYLCKYKITIASNEDLKYSKEDYLTYVLQK
jgi:hypothetical protein